MPTKNTVGNSSPFALCKVIRVTESSSSDVLSISLERVIPSKNSSSEFSANSSSNSIATVNSSSRFAILFSASIVFSNSSAFVYPVRFSISFIKSEISNLFFSSLNFSIVLMNSREFKNTLVNPNSSAFLIISYIDVAFSSAICSILSKLVFPIPRLGSLIILLKLMLSALF